MRYKAVFAISYDATDDQSASTVAHQHHQQLGDVLRGEGADHPQELILEQVLAIEDNGPRMVLAHRAALSTT